MNVFMSKSGMSCCGSELSRVSAFDHVIWSYYGIPTEEESSSNDAKAD
jgi:hypothetical protein